MSWSKVTGVEVADETDAVHNKEEDATGNPMVSSRALAGSSSGGVALSFSVDTALSCADSKEISAEEEVEKVLMALVI